MKEQLRKFGTLILILALCLTSIGTTKVQAASKPSRPSVSLVKRSKTQAKIKIKKRGKATGYQIAVKTSKKARYRIVMPTKKRTVVLRKLKASKVYYVKMMTAWFFATALAKQWDAAIPYLEQNRLDTWTHNKTIQKARESYRITTEQKEYLKRLKVIKILRRNH